MDWIELDWNGRISNETVDINGSINLMDTGDNGNGSLMIGLIGHSNYETKCKIRFDSPNKFSISSMNNNKLTRIDYY